MTSTRNNNQCGDYNLQQKSYSLARQYTSYKYSQYGQAYKDAIPCVGITPSHMPRNTLSRNPVEIESALFGINSTNLVDPQPPTVPDLKSVPEIPFFDRIPLIMPNQLVIERNQRPFPVPQ
jgi:hypothetical protein